MATSKLENVSNPTSDSFAMTGLSGDCYWVKSGNVVTFSIINCHPTTAMSSGAVLNFGVSAYKPKYAVYSFCFDNSTANTHVFDIVEDGNLQIKALANIGTSAVLRGSLTFIIS